MLNRRAIKIQIALKQKGFTQTQIANDLKITESAVSKYVYGVANSRFFDQWLIKNIGEKFFNSLPV